MPKLKPKSHWCNWNDCYCSYERMMDGYCNVCKPRIGVSVIIKMDHMVKQYEKKNETKSN